jgi:hypothetical protein
MMESESLVQESKRIHWRREILEGKRGEQARKRLYSMVCHKFPERYCT